MKWRTRTAAFVLSLVCISAHGLTSAASDPFEFEPILHPLPAPRAHSVWKAPAKYMHRLASHSHAKHHRHPGHHMHGGAVNRNSKLRATHYSHAKLTSVASDPFEFEPILHPLPTPGAHSVWPAHAKHHMHQAHHAHGGTMKLNSKLRATHHSHTKTSAAAKNHAVHFGPQGCVSTYKNAKSECVVKTECAGIDFPGFNLGILCVDKAGVPVRHVFGKASFDSEETFDTQITCDRCMGLDEEPEQMASQASPLEQVAALSGEIKGLTDILSNISSSVVSLNKAVFKPKLIAGPPPAASPAAAPKTAAFLNQAVQQQTDTDDMADAGIELNVEQADADDVA